MPYPTLTFPETLDPETKSELDSLITQLRNFLAAEHADTGAHSTVTADRVYITAIQGTPSQAFALKLSRTDIAGGQGAWLGVPEVSTDPDGALCTNSGTIVLRWGPAGITLPTLALTLSGSNGITLGSGDVTMNGGTLTVNGLTPGSQAVIHHNSIAVDGPVTAGTNFKEHSRSTALGDVIDVPFAAGNFTANSAMTWTVAAQSLYSYTLIGHTLLLEVEVDSTSVGGTPNTDLLIAIPGGFTASRAGIGFIYYSDNGTRGVGLAIWAAGASAVRCLLPSLGNWSASVTNTSVYLKADIWIS